MVPLLLAPRANPATARDAAVQHRLGVNPHDVLILSGDPLAAALLGAVAEVAGHLPSFPRLAEPARSALLRIRPRVVLLDCDHEDACSEAFVGPALMLGAMVLLIRSPRTRRDATAFAERLGLLVIDLPDGNEALVRRLREVPTGEG